MKLENAKFLSDLTAVQTLCFMLMLDQKLENGNVISWLEMITWLGFLSCLSFIKNRLLPLMTFGNFTDTNHSLFSVLLDGLLENLNKYPSWISVRKSPKLRKNPQISSSISNYHPYVFCFINKSFSCNPIGIAASIALVSSRSWIIDFLCFPMSAIWYEWWNRSIVWKTGSIYGIP